ncbi:hypothetical protein Tco_0734238 [Tanacetum coccineum]
MMDVYDNRVKDVCEPENVDFSSPTSTIVEEFESLVEEIIKQKEEVKEISDLDARRRACFLDKFRIINQGRVIHSPKIASSILKEEVHKETLKSHLNPLFEEDEEIISIEASRQISSKVDVKTIVSSCPNWEMFSGFWKIHGSILWKDKAMPTISIDDLQSSLHKCEISIFKDNKDKSEQNQSKPTRNGKGKTRVKNESQNQSRISPIQQGKKANKSQGPMLTSFQRTRAHLNVLKYKGPKLPKVENWFIKKKKKKETTRAGSVIFESHLTLQKEESNAGTEVAIYSKF